MKNKRKFLCMLMGFIFVFMVGCGSSKSISSKGASKDNSISQSENQTKSDKNNTQKDENKKEQDKNSSQKNQSDKNKEQDNKKKDESNKKKDESNKKKNENNKSKEQSSKNKTSQKNKKISKKSSFSTNDLSKRIASSKNSSRYRPKSISKSSVKVSKTNNKSKTFTIILSEEEKGYTGQKSKRIATKKVTVEKDKNAMNYLRDTFGLKERGGFIYELNGICDNYPLKNKTEEQKKLGVMGIDWFIYLNDEKTPVGANDIYPEAGDVLQLDIHQWDIREFSAPES